MNVIMHKHVIVDSRKLVDLSTQRYDFPWIGFPWYIYYTRQNVIQIWISFETIFTTFLKLFYFSVGCANKTMIRRFVAESQLEM